MNCIDFHMHLFPDQMAGRTIASLKAICGCEPCTDGTLGETLKKMDAWGEDVGIVHHIATKPAQQTNVNNFAASIQSPRIHCFGSVHPDAPDALAELDRIKALGLRGVKLHPAYQKFVIDDERVFPIYERIQALGLPVMFHCGWDPVAPEKNYAEPARTARVHRLFPEMIMVCAHLGGMDQCEDSVRDLAGQDVYFDISVASRFCSDRALYAKLLRKHGPDRLLFATDCPWSTAPAEMELLKEVGFAPEDMEKVLWKNAAALLNL